MTADSVVATEDGKILRKPKNINDAREILKLQSGSNIAIISAMHYKTESFYLTDISATYYTFAPFDKDDLENYLKSGKWQGKAGGCMVEGFCKKYIQKVQGYESTAMGLCVERLKAWL